VIRTNFALLAVLTASAALAQSPAFEVAVIKPVSMDQFNAEMQSGQRPRIGWTIDKNRVTITFQSLSDIVARAYEVLRLQLVGPDFLKTERFDIMAKLPAGATEEQVPQMLRALLKERFGLVAHQEKKELSIYALVVSKSGLNSMKMKPATAEEIRPEPMEGDQTQSTPFGKMTVREIPGKGVVGFMPGLGTLKVTVGGGGEHIEMSNLSMVRFAQMLMADAGDRAVVDKTGLKGSFEASVDISQDGQAPLAQSPGMPPTPPPNPMFLAAEQLGLKLEPQKDSVDMIVIDHIEKTPTEN
jgi:uncharacterized protein (TIGR03435 family)